MPRLLDTGGISPPSTRPHMLSTAAARKFLISNNGIDQSGPSASVALSEIIPANVRAKYKTKTTLSSACGGFNPLPLLAFLVSN